jgi:hypothetical protein
VESTGKFSAIITVTMFKAKWLANHPRDPAVCLQVRLELLHRAVEETQNGTRDTKVTPLAVGRGINGAILPHRWVCVTCDSPCRQKQKWFSNTSSSLALQPFKFGCGIRFGFPNNIIFRRVRKIPKIDY